MAVAAGASGVEAGGLSSPSLAQVEELMRLKKVISRALPVASDGPSGSAASAAAEDERREEVGPVLDALAALDGFKVTKALLAKSRIGLTVGALRRHSNPEIRSKSCALVAKWKNSISQPNLKTSSSTSSSDSASSATAAGGGRPPAAASTTPPPAAAAAGAAAAGRGSLLPPLADSGRRGPLPPPAPRPASSGAPSVSQFSGPHTGDTTRDKARAFLWRALVDGLDSAAAATAGSNSAVETGRVAAAIESALWEKFIVQRQSTKEYNAQLKTLKWNLADPKNPDLNLKVLWGMYTAEQLASMSSAELASEEKKREREQQKQESLEACQSDWEHLSAYVDLKNRPVVSSPAATSL
ncbi:hypothetical protein Efla_005581 [Eimeria flavescens]